MRRQLFLLLGRRRVILPNLLALSEQFDNVAWSKNASTVTANTADTTDPIGGSTADKIANSTTTPDSPIVYQTITSTAGAHTQSVYAKKGTANFLSMFTYDGATVLQSGFNLDTGAADLTAAGHTLAIVGVGNGWYRCSVTYAYPSTTVRAYAGVYKTSGNPSYTPSGIGADYIYAWGAMVNTGAALAVYAATT